MTEWLPCYTYDVLVALFFSVRNVKLCSDKPKSINPNCLTLWKEPVSTWSISLVVL